MGAPLNILELRNITKTFPGVIALENVDLDVVQGEVHILVGENGAGKSSLIKLLCGIYFPDQGEIFYAGEPYVPRNPLDADARRFHTASISSTGDASRGCGDWPMPRRSQASLELRLKGRRRRYGVLMLFRMEQK